MKSEVNGYYFRNLLKKTRRQFVLLAAEQALYQELIDICNDMGWSTRFNVSNGELSSALNCSEKTLGEWRKKLVEAGLIKFESGQSKRAHGMYEMVVGKVVKITTNTATNTTTNVNTNTSYIIDKLKEKETKTNNSKSHSAKAVKVDKPKKENKATEHWQKLVDEWFVFYEKNYEIKPTFAGPDSKSLKSIVEKLQKISLAGNYGWSEKMAVDCLLHFLTKAKADKWLAANFLLTNLNSKFDSIVTPKNNGQQQQSTSKPATGANVDIGSIFTKIDGMLD